MSYQLTLFPLRGPRDLIQTSILCQTQLVFGQDYRVYAQVDELNFLDSSVKVTVKTKLIPDQLWVQLYEESGIETTRNNRQGSELHFAYAENFKKLVLPEDVDWKTRAVMAYVNALPNDVPILVYF